MQDRTRVFRNSDIFVILQCEQKISELEKHIDELKFELSKDENISDYIKLGELNEQLTELEENLLIEMENWEELSTRLSDL